MSMNMNTAVPAATAAPRGWWSRNWKWFVPASLLGVVLVCCGGPAAIVFGVMKTLSSSEPYQMALKAVQNDPQVKEALGGEVNPSWVVGGTISTENDRGEATLTFMVTGPKGAASVLAKGNRVGGNWAVPSVDVTLPDGRQIKVKTTGAPGDLDEAPLFKP